MNRRTINTVSIIVGLAVVCLLGLGATGQAIQEREVVAAATFALFAAIIYALPYAMSNGANGSPFFAAHLSSVVLAPTWSTVAIATVSSALGEVLIRRQPIKAAFNVAQQTVAVSAAVGVFNLLGSPGLLYSDDNLIFHLLAGWCAYYFVNTCSVASVIAASTGRVFKEVWAEGALSGFVFDLLVLPFVYLFAQVYVRFGALPTVGMLALLLILRQLNSANEALHSSNRELLELTVTTLEARDPYTSGHSRRVAQYSRMIGQAINLSQKQLDRLAVAALLHDVGKIHEVFAPILSKPGRLTPEERAVMETHPIKGAELVKISSQLRDAVEPIRHHHEAWDGSGYPDGIKGDAIPLFARIIAIADTIDAMASDRPYRRGLSGEKIRDELIRMRGVQFDPAMIDQLVRSRTIDSILRIATENGSALGAGEQKLALVTTASA